MGSEKLPGLQTKQPNIKYGQRGEPEKFVDGGPSITYKVTTGKSGTTESKSVGSVTTNQIHSTPES